MPKLIIKHEAGVVTQKLNYAKWLSVGGFLILLVAAATAAIVFTKAPATSSGLARLSLNSAPESIAKSSYVSLYAILAELDAEYEGIAAHDVDDYQENLKLLGKSESILSHLNKMDAAAGDLDLDTNEKNKLSDQHQFYKDYWQAKLNFRELRVSRFKSDNGQVEIEPVADISPMPLDNAESPKPKKKFQFAKPPEDMVLPAGFCNLSDADSCKSVSAADAVFEKAELVNKPESELVPVSDSNTSGEVIADKPKRKFQFAKPPEGMELPAGFCDLSNPDSCKPEDEIRMPVASQEMRVELASDEGVSSQPKKKFRFATPPAGMELPEGFCDLTNPDSCKPEAEDNSNISDSTNSEVVKKNYKQGG